MIDHRWNLLAGVVLAAGGCATHAPAEPLAGARSVRLAGVTAGAEAVIPVEHVFELSNTGAEPVVIRAQRTRINTVWVFADTGNSALPREVAPGESVPVAVTAKVRPAGGPQQFYVKLELATGETVRLDLVFDG